MFQCFEHFRQFRLRKLPKRYAHNKFGHIEPRKRYIHNNLAKPEACKLQKQAIKQEDHGILYAFVSKTIKTQKMQTRNAKLLHCLKRCIWQLIKTHQRMLLSCLLCTQHAARQPENKTTLTLDSCNCLLFFSLFKHKTNHVATHQCF